MNNAEWLLKQGIKFDDVYLTAPVNYTYVIKDKTGRRLGSVDNSYSEISAFKKWLDSEHKEQILDDAEKRYLKGVIRPFRDKVLYIAKRSIMDRRKEHIYIDLTHDVITLPCFMKGTMYKGMKLNRSYTLEELGL